ncbi:MAG: hypothetical protein M5U27_06965 [Gaiella sp.]|nr:hypothetical protein [Gaiella sp.]
MPDVEPRIDDRDRHARPRRRESLDADLAEPPLLALQRLGRVGRGRHAIRPLALREDERVSLPKRRQR